MNLKKILCGVLATSMALSIASVSAFAASYTANDVINADDETFDDGTIDTTASQMLDSALNKGIINLDPVQPGTTFYVKVGGKNADVIHIDSGKMADVSELSDSDNFKFDVKKDENGKMIKKISLVSDKKIPGSSDRTSWLKFELNDSTTTSEIKSTGKVTFKAKNAKDANKKPGKPNDASLSASVWEKGDEVTVEYNLWINNKEEGNDGNPDTGDRIYFNPDKNDTNTLIWGDDRAALKFDSDDDASKFYARLSTKINQDIYVNYGDPVNADLYFYDFVGSSAIPSTSRATLTLGIPWDEDADYVPDPSNVFIYELDADGNMTDVTSSFKYSEDDEEISGWSTRIRTLGSYVLSDTELDIDAINSDNSSSEEEVSSSEPTTEGDKNLPNTGASDMVGVAMAAAVASLAAAGAMAFKKASKK